MHGETSNITRVTGNVIVNCESKRTRTNVCLLENRSARPLCASPLKQDNEPFTTVVIKLHKREIWSAHSEAPLFWISFPDPSISYPTDLDIPKLNIPQKISNNQY